MESRIKEIRVYKFPLPASTVYNMSSSQVTTPESTIVEIIDSKGVRGYGEACMATPQAQLSSNEKIRSSLKILASALIGAEPTNLSFIQNSMDEALKAESESKAAIDIACWDLLGKTRAATISDLLGGAKTKRVTTYHEVGIGDPETAARETQNLQKSGINRIQLKAGGRSIELDIECILAVSRVIAAGATLDVDANCGWSEEEAIEVSQACSSVSMSLEQPCATEEALYRIKPHLLHPLIVDESASDFYTISKMISSGLADGFGMKISRVGGLTEMRMVRNVCIDNKIPMSSDDAWGGDIVTAAGVALGSTMPAKLNRGAWISYPYHQIHYDEINGPSIKDGYVPLPEGGNGLGLSIKEGFFGDPEFVNES